MATLKLVSVKVLRLTLSKPVACIHPCVQSVRWRKPRWLPRAPSKEFYVREPTPIDPVEYEELKWRYDQYRSTVEAIREHLAEDLKTEETKLVTDKVVEEEEWNQMLKLTDEWNKKVASVREKRQAQEEFEELQKYKQIKEQKQADVLSMIEEAKRKVQFEKEQKFITTENLDEEIEKVLNTKVTYDYAIDESGYRYTQKGKKISPTKDKKSVTS